MVAGHSYGELVALHAAGALDAAALARLSLARGRLMREAGGADAGAMAALVGGPDEIDRLIRDCAGSRGRQLEQSQADRDRRADRGRAAEPRAGRSQRNPRPALAG